MPSPGAWSGTGNSHFCPNTRLCWRKEHSLLILFLIYLLDFVVKFLTLKMQRHMQSGKRVHATNFLTLHSNYRYLYLVCIHLHSVSSLRRCSHQTQKDSFHMQLRVVEKRHFNKMKSFTIKWIQHTLSTLALKKFDTATMLVYNFITLANNLAALGPVFQSTIRLILD